MKQTKEIILDYLKENGPCGYIQLQNGLGLTNLNLTRAIKELYREDKVLASGSLETMSLATKSYVKIWLPQDG